MVYGNQAKMNNYYRPTATAAETAAEAKAAAAAVSIAATNNNNDFPIPPPPSPGWQEVGMFASAMLARSSSSTAE